MKNRLKSLFISVYLGGSASGLVYSIVAMASNGMSWGWAGAVLSCAGPVAFITRMFARPTARTSRTLPWVICANVAGSCIAVAGVGFLSAAAIVAVTTIVATLLYVRWYSRFGAPSEGTLQPGSSLPPFALSEQGRRIESDTLVKKPALWVFYRGNWCPVCVAQIQEICAQYHELARRGIEVFFVSPQPEANSSALASRCNAPMRFLTDAGNEAAATLGILEQNGLPAGMQAFGYDSDVPRPTVVLTAPGGRVLHCEMTDNYRVRPEPGQFLDIFDRHAAA